MSLYKRSSIFALSLLLSACGSTSLSGDSGSKSNKPAEKSGSGSDEDEDDEASGSGSGSGSKGSSASSKGSGSGPADDIVTDAPQCKDAKISLPTSGKKDKLVVGLALAAPNDQAFLALASPADETVEGAVVVAQALEVSLSVSAIAVEKLHMDAAAYELRLVDPTVVDGAGLLGETAPPAAGDSKLEGKSKVMWRCPIPKDVATGLELPDAAPEAPSPSVPATNPPAAPVSSYYCVLNEKKSCNQICADHGQLCTDARCSNWTFAGNSCGSLADTVCSVPCDSVPGEPNATVPEGSRQLDTARACTCQ